ncbi:MAG: hypothetical protein HYZ42_04840 [Bacteroidetes bacterium]|nr:hypothetical protein [Bacteroidota bacterium]
MNRIILIIFFLSAATFGCSSVGGFYDNNPVLVNIIENSIGKPVNYFYDQLQANSLDPEHLQSRAMTNEEHQDFGIEMKFPPKTNNGTSRIVLRIRFDMHRKSLDSSQSNTTNTFTAQPKVFQLNGKYIIEFIRVIEYENNKIIFSRIFDKSMGSDINQPSEYISTLRMKRKK